MLDWILELFEITPRVDLNQTQSGQTLAAMTARIVDQLTLDAVIVQGDTTTTFCSTPVEFRKKRRRSAKRFSSCGTSRNGRKDSTMKSDCSALTKFASWKKQGD
jgi:hypothetical protein